MKKHIQLIIIIFLVGILFSSCNVNQSENLYHVPFNFKSLTSTNQPTIDDIQKLGVEFSITPQMAADVAHSALSSVIGDEEMKNRICKVYEQALQPEDYEKYGDYYIVTFPMTENSVDGYQVYVSKLNGAVLLIFLAG